MNESNVIPTVELIRGALTEERADQVLRLGREASLVDATHPLSEHAQLHLTRESDHCLHLIVTGGAESGQILQGYAQAHFPSDDARFITAELVVHPQFRRRGLGRALVEALDRTMVSDASTANELRLWAHGTSEAADHFAAALGFRSARSLLQLRRPLRVPIQSPGVLHGVRIRSFVVGQDEDAWLELNARAFAEHPEQGAITRADLEARKALAWFDPEGFFIAEDAHGTMLGFHWTKIHPDTGGTSHQHDSQESPPTHGCVGEVYVLGVHPDAGGQGLGATLAAAGLTYLRDRGLDQVMLYVDAENHAAVNLYRRMGFGPWSSDVLMVRSLD